jgi:hypothetical protein
MAWLWTRVLENGTHLEVSLGSDVGKRPRAHAATHPHGPQHHNVRGHPGERGRVKTVFRWREPTHGREEVPRGGYAPSFLRRRCALSSASFPPRPPRTLAMDARLAIFSDTGIEPAARRVF